MYANRRVHENGRSDRIRGGVDTGKRVKLGMTRTRRESDAAKVLDRYPAGKAGTVSYNPSNPDEAPLEPGIQGAVLIMPVLGLVFGLSGLLIVGLALKSGGR